MKSSRVLDERVRRLRVLFAELGFRLIDSKRSDGVFTATFRGRDFEGGVYTDVENRFLELSYVFAFPAELGDFLKARLEEMLRICYDYGCYISIQSDESEVVYSLFSKEYFAGLNYYALRDNLRDFEACVETLTALLDVEPDEETAAG